MQTILLSGSNQGDRIYYLTTAQELISNAGEISMVSSLYETEPWGFNHPDPFLNQAILLETPLSPNDLLAFLLSAEHQLGRKRVEKQYVPRNIDIDILFYGQEIIDTPRLTIPHPRLHLRRFALIPAAEICPDWIHPVFRQTLTQLKDQCRDKLKVTRYRGK